MSASAPIADVQAPPASDNQMMDGLLADLARQKPGLAWLQQMLAMQRQAAAAQATGTPDVQAEAQAEIAALRDALAQAEVRMERLAAANRRLAAELEAARERIADAAATVGACGLCWGEDPRCRSCRGRGKPGLFVRQVGASSPDGEGAAAAF
ncbi:MAG TPA: hypothetical protein VKY24_15380 [Reyranella sp.]|jgi:hypothetical protein|nr:hypothetical protein [Reyranella sp.]